MLYNKKNYFIINLIFQIHIYSYNVYFHNAIRIRETGILYGDNQFLHNVFLGDDVSFIIYGSRSSYTPTDSTHDFSCTVPNTDPEQSFCGPDALRETYRTDFYNGYLDFYLHQRTALDFWAVYANSGTSRCARALYNASHPFTCRFTSAQTGR